MSLNGILLTKVNTVTLRRMDYKKGNLELLLSGSNILENLIFMLS